MPTPESVAIREELAIGRIEEAAVTLKERTGAEFERIDLNVYMAPIERQAVVLEQIATMLESLVVVLQEPIEPDPQLQRRAGKPEGDTDKGHASMRGVEESEPEEGKDGTTEQGRRRPSPRR